MGDIDGLRPVDYDPTDDDGECFECGMPLDDCICDLVGLEDDDFGYEDGEDASWL